MAKEREDIWRTIRIEKSVAKVIDDHITKYKRFGAQVYYSRTDFAREACTRLLESEMKIKREKEKEKLEVTAWLSQSQQESEPNKRDEKIDKAIYILAAMSKHVHEHKNCKCCNKILEEALY